MKEINLKDLENKANWWNIEACIELMRYYLSYNNYPQVLIWHNKAIKFNPAKAYFLFGLNFTDINNKDLELDFFIKSYIFWNKEALIYILETFSIQLYEQINFLEEKFNTCIYYLKEAEKTGMYNKIVCILFASVYIHYYLAENDELIHINIWKLIDEWFIIEASFLMMLYEEKIK